MEDESDATHEEKHEQLPENGPTGDLYWKAVPIWCGESHDVLTERFGDEWPCGYAAGFEEGIVMAMLRPEWAQGLYHALRQHYLVTHTEEDLEDWEHHAEETTRAIPIHRLSPEPPLDRVQGLVPSAAPVGVHDVDLPVPVPEAGEGDLRAIR